MNDILAFTGEHRWLSNFAPVHVVFDSQIYPSVEHAYQAAKTLDDEWRARILAAPSAVRAKKLGRLVPIRPTWNDIRLEVMEALVKRKFSQEPYLSKLLATGNVKIVEGNYWRDYFWGVCDGKGANHLGKIIMKVRERLRERV